MGFSDELWDGFDKTTTRVTQGKQFCTEFQSFTKKRIEIERDYAKRLQALSKSSKVTEIGTIDSAWMSLKSETETLANAHAAFADALTSRVDESLKQWLNETQKQRKQLKVTGKKLIADFDSAKQGVDKAKIKYEASRKKQDATQAESSADPANTKTQKKLAGDQKTSEKNDDAYKKAIEKLRGMENRFYDTDLPQILKEYEAMEMSRLRLLKEVMRNFADAQLAIPPSEKSAAESMKNRIDAVNIDADIQQFVANTKTGQQKPPRVQYEAYDSALGACRATGGSSGEGGGLPRATSNRDMSISSPGPSNGAGPARTTMNFGAVSMGGNNNTARGAPYRPEPSPRTVSVVPTATPAYSPAISPANGDGETFSVRALYSYTGTEDTELSFNAGDIILVTYKDESGWWEGDLNGKVGVFPSNHVETIPSTSKPVGAFSPSPPIASPIASSPPSGDKSQFERCKALYEYKAEDDDELTIKEGDTMTIEDEDDEGWYYGTNQRGEYGKFPSNYVAII